MNRQPMLLDCDTGVDDAVAILLTKHLPCRVKFIVTHFLFLLFQLVMIRSASYFTTRSPEHSSMLL